MASSSRTAGGRVNWELLLVKRSTRRREKPYELDRLLCLVAVRAGSSPVIDRQAGLDNDWRRNPRGGRGSAVPIRHYVGMDNFTIDLLSVSIGLGVSLVSVWTTQLLSLVRESYGRKASVRDQAYAKTVDACAEFVGISHLHLGRAHDYVASLYRIKQENTTLAYPGRKLDMQFVADTFMPITEKILVAGTRAEALVTDEETRQLIEKMQRCNQDASLHIQQGNKGSLSPDWEQRLDRLIVEHDQASHALVDHVRRLGAKTTYRSR
jgi:hypothetical protein